MLAALHSQRTMTRHHAFGSAAHGSQSLTQPHRRQPNCCLDLKLIRMEGVGLDVKRQMTGRPQAGQLQASFAARVPRCTVAHMNTDLTSALTCALRCPQGPVQAGGGRVAQPRAVRTGRAGPVRTPRCQAGFGAAAAGGGCPPARRRLVRRVCAQIMQTGSGSVSGSTKTESRRMQTPDPCFGHCRDSLCRPCESGCRKRRWLAQRCSADLASRPTPVSCSRWCSGQCAGACSS